jgi:hypothetical protein
MAKGVQVTDSELIQQIKAGDSQAFSLLGQIRVPQGRAAHQQAQITSHRRNLAIFESVRGAALGSLRGDNWRGETGRCFFFFDHPCSGL